MGRIADVTMNSRAESQTLIPDCRGTRCRLRIGVAMNMVTCSALIPAITTVRIGPIIIEAVRSPPARVLEASSFERRAGMSRCIRRKHTSAGLRVNLREQQEIISWLFCNWKF